MVEHYCGTYEKTPLTTISVNREIHRLLEKLILSLWGNYCVAQAQTRLYRAAFGSDTKGEAPGRYPTLFSVCAFFALERINCPYTN